MFLLYSVCTSTINEGKCTHSDEERSILGKWIVDEVLQSVEMGYSLVDVFEIWEYSVTCFDESTKSVGLFTDDVDMFVKIKQESSSYRPGFQVTKTGTGTLRTTSAQRELLKTRRQFPKLWGNYFGKAKIKLNVRQMVTEPEQDTDIFS